MTADLKNWKNVAIIGARGGIGSAFTDHLAINAERIFAFSRQGQKDQRENISSHAIDVHNEESIKEAADITKENGPLDLVLVTIGTLHSEDYAPEKSFREFDHESFKKIFEINTIAPAIVAKYFIPLLSKNSPAVFAALSARIGSIGDNRIGGWSSYRASKAALNMIIKNLSIEAERSNAGVVIVGLHPGTVDTKLSKPYQSSVKAEKLFTAKYSTQKMLEVIAGLSPDCSGKCFAWDGQEIDP